MSGGKIRTLQECADVSRSAKSTGQSVALVLGSFDGTHPFHSRLLEQARSMADVVVIGVQRHGIPPGTSGGVDLSVAESVDAVLACGDTELVVVLETIRPDVLVVTDGQLPPDWQDPETLERMGVQVFRPSTLTAAIPIMVKRNQRTVSTKVKSYLRNLAEQYTPRDVEHAVAALRKLRVCGVSPMWTT